MALSLLGSIAACNDIFDSKTCSVGGRLYEQGMTFKPTGDCNTCTCDANGQVSCTLIACTPAPASCAFDTTYTYGFEGSNALYEDHGTLSPPATYSLTRESISPGVATAVGCGPALPACQSSPQIDVSDIMRDLSQIDVRAALALPSPPIYGRDLRPVDGPIYGIHRADGRGMLVGSSCTDPATVTSQACTPTPVGVQQLVDDLQALDKQQRMDPSCAAFNPS